MIHADTVEALPTHGQAPLHYSTLTLLSIIILQIIIVIIVVIVIVSSISAAQQLDAPQ